MLCLRKLGDGLFLQCCEEVAELYPKIKFDTMIIDNCCMQVRILIPCPTPRAVLYLLLLHVLSEGIKTTGVKADTAAAADSSLHEGAQRRFCRSSALCQLRAGAAGTEAGRATRSLCLSEAYKTAWMPGHPALLSRALPAAT